MWVPGKRAGLLIAYIYTVTMIYVCAVQRYSKGNVLVLKLQRATFHLEAGSILLFHTSSTSADQIPSSSLVSHLHAMSTLKQCLARG